MNKILLENFKMKAEKAVQYGDEVIVSMENENGHVVMTTIPDDFEVGKEIWLMGQNGYCRVVGDFSFKYDEDEEEYIILTSNGSFTFSFL